MSQEVYGFEPLKSVYARVGQLLESRHIAQTTVTTIMQKTAGTETETLQLEFSEDPNLPPNPKIRLMTTLHQFRDKPAREITSRRN